MRRFRGCQRQFRAVLLNKSPQWMGLMRFVASEGPDKASVRPGIHQTPIVDKLWTARSSGSSVSAVKHETIAERNLEPRSPSRSRLSVTYNFAEDEGLRDRWDGFVGFPHFFRTKPQ
jgi:hypothetical protein